MELPIHSQIFTPSPTPSGTFDCFSKLPPELRNEIWHHAMRHRRMIKIQLSSRNLVDAVMRTMPECMPKNQVSVNYGLVVTGYQTMSKFFRISRESRDAALGFYRVHLPCWLAKGPESIFENSGILYLNPEHDCIRFINNSGPIHEFWSDLKSSYDPHHIGLLNLAIDTDSLVGPSGLCHIDASSVAPRVLECFKETLLQIREVFFEHMQLGGRYIHGIRNGLESNVYAENLAIPLEAPGVNFDFLRPDPRSVAADLSRVYIHNDPGEAIQAWRRLRHTWLGDLAKVQPEERVLLSLRIYFKDRHSRLSVTEKLQEKQEAWLKETQQARNALIECTPSAAQTAFGFWLFPTDAFAWSKSADRSEGLKPKLVDLTAYHPELGLSNILQGSS